MTSYLSEWPSSKKSINNTSWKGCGEKGILLHYWWECKLIQPLWRTEQRFLQFSHSVVSDSLRPHELQHPRPPCPSPTPRVHSDSCPSSWWCHPASVIPFSSCPQSLPASPWRREWQPTPVFLPGEFHGQRSLRVVAINAVEKIWITFLYRTYSNSCYLCLPTWLVIIISFVLFKFWC